jgi:hypothetical protein
MQMEASYSSKKLTSIYRLHGVAIQKTTVVICAVNYELCPCLFKTLALSLALIFHLGSVDAQNIIKRTLKIRRSCLFNSETRTDVDLSHELPE